MATESPIPTDSHPSTSSSTRNNNNLNGRNNVNNKTLGNTSGKGRFGVLISIVKSATVAVFALWIFCTSFIISVCQTLFYQTLPETRDKVLEFWKLQKPQVLTALRTLLDRGRQFTLVRWALWWLNIYLLMGRKLLQIAQDVLLNVYNSTVVTEIREKFEDLKFRSGFTEFLYSLVAMVVVCNVVLARFVLVQIWNLRLFILSPSTSSSSSKFKNGGGFGGPYSNININAEDDNGQGGNDGAGGDIDDWLARGAATGRSAFEKLAGYSQKFATPTNFKGMSKKSATTGQFNFRSTEPAQKSSSSTRRSVVEVFSASNHEERKSK